MTIKNDFDELDFQPLVPDENDTVGDPTVIKWLKELEKTGQNPPIDWKRGYDKWAEEQKKKPKGDLY